MLTYTIRRILITIPVFFGMTLMIWLLSTTNPDGGALSSYLGRFKGKEVSQQTIDNLKRSLGLDQPLPVRYVIWLKNLFRGDLGTSQSSHQPVSDLIKSRLFPTILLLGTALILQEIIAIPLGVYSAIKRGTLFDKVFTVLTYVTFSFPTFWLGLLAIIFFGVELKILPFSGMVDLRADGGYAYGTPDYWVYFHANTVAAVLDIARHMILPVSILGIVGMAADARYTRSQMLDVLNQDFVRTARAKGLSQRVVVWKHALRNAVLPLVTNIGLQLPGVIGGAIITEQIFTWPGTGQLYINAAQTFDYAVVIAYLVLLGGLVLVFNIITDLSYALVDPRIRYN